MRYLHSQKQTKTIHIWDVDYGYLQTNDKTIRASSDVLGMECSYPYLFTRFKSQFIKFYEFECFKERIYDNEQEVVEMCSFNEGIMTVDVKNDIR